MVTLALAGVTASTVRVLPHQQADAWGKCGGPGPMAGRRCFSSAMASSEGATQLSAQPNGGVQRDRSHLQHPSVQQLRHLQWCPGAWQQAASLLRTPQGQLGYAPLCNLSPNW